MGKKQNMNRPFLVPSSCLYIQKAEEIVRQIIGAIGEQICPGTETKFS